MGVSGWGAAKDVIRWEIEAGSSRSCVRDARSAFARWNVWTLERWERREEMELKRAGETGRRGWSLALRGSVLTYTGKGSMGVARS
jgi:hypothetical protein